MLYDDRSAADEVDKDAADLEKEYAAIRLRELEHQVLTMSEQIRSMKRINARHMANMLAWKKYAAFLHCSFRYQMGFHLAEAIKHPRQALGHLRKCVGAFRRRNEIPFQPWPGKRTPSDEELRRLCRAPAAEKAKTAPAPAPVPEYVSLEAEKAEARRQGKRVWIIKCPARYENKVIWGDYHFALSLQKALEKRGEFVEVQLYEHWDRSDDADVILVLRGRFVYQPRRVAGRVNIMWNISHPEDITDEEYNGYDAVFVSSNYYAGILARRLKTQVYPLLQCTDVTAFYETEEETQAERKGLVFIGNGREDGRPCVGWAIDYKADVHLYGEKWNEFLPDGHLYVKAPSIDNKDIRAVYVAAKATLNDHWASMLAYQFINNRVFDALACGLPVITDSFDELKTLFPDELLYYHDEASLRACIDRLNSDYDEILRKTRALKERIRAEFSFDARAETLMGHAQRLQAERAAADAAEDDGTWDVCFLWKQNDTGLFGRRSDMVMKYLAQDPRIHKIVSFDTPIGATWLRRNASAEGDVPYSRNEYMIRKIRAREDGDVVSEKLVQYNYVIPENQRYEPSAYRAYVRRVLEKEGIGRRRVMLWVCPKVFQINELLEEIHPDLMIADYIDDERQFPQSEEDLIRISENYGQILRLSDHIFCNCEHVRDMLCSMNPDRREDIHVFPNAAELPEAVVADGEVPERLKGIGHPIIGYAGNLSEKFDVELAEYLSDARPEWQFVYIGSMHLDNRLASLADRSNVHLLNVVPYDELPAYIRQFDVAIMPHKTNAQSEAMNPLKLFVYAAHHKPIVTIDVPNIDQVKGIARLATDYADFVRQIEAALEDPCAIPEEQYRQLFQENNWTKRIRDMLEIVFAEA